MLSKVINKTGIKVLFAGIMAGIMGLSVVSASSFSITTVSSFHSSINPSEQIAKSNDSPIVLTVTLLDSNMFPVEGHEVALISSSSVGNIVPVVSRVSDKNGKVSFKVDVPIPGAVTYTAYDLTDNVILSQRARILYFDDLSQVFSNKKSTIDYKYASYGNSSGVVKKLKFGDVPVVIKPGETLNFKVSAHDNLDQIVTNYNGKVRFEVTSGDPTAVILPNDYTFGLADLGEHVFTLATLFKLPGTYTVKVSDVSDPDIYAEQIFTVAAPSGVSASVITITTPVAGMYGNNIQTIQGQAPKGAKLKIFSNDIEIGAVTADINGNFSFVTTPLPEGVYKIHVAQVNEIGTILSTSSVVSITIKNSKPEISGIEILPAVEVEASSEVTVRIYPKTSDIEKVSLVLVDNIYDCVLVGNYFETKFVAPQEFGSYSFAVILSDTLKNESKIENAGLLKVKGQLTSPPTTIIGDVGGLIARPEDRRVILNWHAPKVAVNLVKNYRVYYGVSQSQLIDVVDTFTNATTWYIPNLENGTEYFFAVVAVDEKGNISEHYSNIVSAVPNPIVIEVPSPDIDKGIVGGENLEHMEEDVSKTGPSLSILLLLSSLGGIGYNEFRRYRYIRRNAKNSQ